MDSIQKAEDTLKAGNTPPHVAAEMRGVLSGEYSFNAGVLEDVLTRKPSTWVRLRKETGSDKQADKAWEQTEDGINETILRLRMKRIEKLISAFSTIIKLASDQSRNMY